MKEIEKLKKRNKGLVIIIVLLIILVGVMTAIAQNQKQNAENSLKYAVNQEIYAAERLGITENQFFEDFLEYFSNCLITEKCDILY